MTVDPPASDVERILLLHRAGAHRGLPATATHHVEVRSPFCGDRLELGLVVAKGRIVEAGFDGELCAVASATASLLCGDLVGRALADVRSWHDEHALTLLGISLIQARVPCAVLPMRAMRIALGERDG